jgi:hypothetical protein
VKLLGRCEICVPITSVATCTGYMSAELIDAKSAVPTWMYLCVNVVGVLCEPTGDARIADFKETEMIHFVFKFLTGNWVRQLPNCLHLIPVSSHSEATWCMAS